MVQPIPFTAPPSVSEAIAALGRTEDVSFSPANRRLAIAAFSRNRLLVLDLTVTPGDRGPSVALTGGTEIGSSSLRHPHGVDFLDEDTAIITNRDGQVVTFKIPPGAPDVPRRDLKPASSWTNAAAALLRAPGSVWVERSGTELEVLVCNNDGHTVSRHVLTSAAADGPVHNEVLLSNCLDVPDSASVSPDGRWIAVSNHTSHDVLLFARPPGGASPADPAGVLRGVRYPHGLCFDRTGTHLLVADAGGPWVHVFDAGPDEWQGLRLPSRSVPIMDEETFGRAAHTVESGGPKGLDVDATGTVVAVTSEAQPLALFAVADLLSDTEGVWSGTDARAREFSHALWRIGATHALARRARENGALVRYFRNSLSWRATAPLRKLDALWRGRR